MKMVNPRAERNIVAKTAFMDRFNSSSVRSDVEASASELPSFFGPFITNVSLQSHNKSNMNNSMFFSTHTFCCSGWYARASAGRSMNELISRVK